VYVNIAAENKLPTLLIERERFFRGNAYIPELKEHAIQFIVLAGFLWKIPDPLIKAFAGNIINIHPALCPNMVAKECMVLLYTSCYCSQRKRKRYYHSFCR
jgi:phosphoribosylglycinamide formyltransferase-1